jgi:hypothetical protein
MRSAFCRSKNHKNVLDSILGKLPKVGAESDFEGLKAAARDVKQQLLLRA